MRPPVTGARWYGPTSHLSQKNGVHYHVCKGDQCSPEQPIRPVRLHELEQPIDREPDRQSAQVIADDQTLKTRISLHQLSIDQFDTVQLLLEHECRRTGG